MSDEFEFTITDAARFLGKSPVTLRKWERQRLFKFPRVGGDRRLNSEDLRALASTAYARNRIKRHRADAVFAVCTLLEGIERENRCPRTTRRREE